MHSKCITCPEEGLKSLLFLGYGVAYAGTDLITNKAVTGSANQQPQTVLKGKVHRKQAAAPANEMDAGIACFGKHDYRSALAHFTAALTADPNNCNALYYEAVTLHQLKEMKLAKQAYATVITRYPGTEAARNAQAALNYLNPTFLKQFQQQVVSAARSSGSVSAAGGPAHGT